MKISISKTKVRGETKWVVSWTPPGGKRIRHFHGTKAEAETEKETVAGRTAQTGTAWQGWTADLRNEVISLVAEAQDRGYTLRQAADFYWANRELANTDTTQLRSLVQEVALEGFTLRQAVEFYRANRQVAECTMKVGEAYRLFIAEMENRLVGKKSMAGYRSIVGRFIEPRTNAPLSSVTRDDVMTWLTNEEWGPATFNSYLTTLHTFFTWCENSHKVRKAPTATIEKIDPRRMPNHGKPPVILSLLQVGRLLKATMDKDPGLIPYVAVGLFAGLRPDSEANKLPKCDILNDENRIFVRGKNAKDRQARFVTIHPTLKAWLEVGGDFAKVEEDGTTIHPIVNLRKRFLLVREAAGLVRVEREGWGRTLKQKIQNTGWEQDCLRHTFASNYLPVFGAEKTIEQMGHGDYGVLFRHYRALVRPEEAAKFWEITPDVVKSNNLKQLLGVPLETTPET